MRRTWCLVLAVLLSVLVVGPSPAAAVDSEPGPGCSVDWIAAAKDNLLETTSQITGLRAGQQPCFDRLVVDLRGDPARMSVRYVDVVRTSAAGFPIPLRGGARLEVVLHAPDHEPDFTPTYDPPNPDEAVNVTGFATFRQVAYDGSFEGIAIVGLGVRERLPFRVLALAGPGAGSRLVIDVAHAWTGSPGPRGANPVGNLERVAGLPGGVEVKGWMLDPDTTDPGYAWVTVDGVGRHLFAGVGRPDLAAAFPGYGSGHAFLGTVPASPGRRTVCVTASNEGPGGHTLLGCQAVNVPDPSPFGNFEDARVSAGGIQVKGWMVDPNTTAMPIYAWVTVDGVGRHLLANADRPDVGAAFPAFGSQHGFLGSVPAAPGRRTVCVTASNVGPGSHTPLGCRVVTVPGPSPFGTFDGARGTADGIEVWGWMADPDAPTTPLFAWVTVDGAGRHLLANGERTDVAAAFPGYGSMHGFRATIPAAPGAHRVCVTAANVGAGSHTSLGCRLTTFPSIAYLRDFQVWLMGTDGANPRPLVTSPVVTGPAQWSPDGTMLAFTGFDPARPGDRVDDVWVVDADGRNPRNVTRLTGRHSAISVSWSPDGSRLVWGTTEWDLRTSDLDGGNRAFVTADVHHQSAPAWSPDGSLIAYCSMPVEGNLLSGRDDIWVVEPDGSNPRKLTGTGSSCNPAWSPDGTQIAFVTWVFPDDARDDHADVWVMNADGTNQRNVTRNPARIDRNPAWSPDGSLLAFDSAGPFRVRELPGGGELIENVPPSDIYVIPAAGGTPTRLTTGDQYDVAPAWEPVP